MRKWAPSAGNRSYQQADFTCWCWVGLAHFIWMRAGNKTILC
jgi:hypothetical protein